MRRNLLTRVLTVSAAAVAALPAAAAAAQDNGDGGSGDVVAPVLWTIGGILLALLALAVFQMLKRQLGGFEHPDWVAPIGAVYSSDLPTDEEPAVMHMGHDIQEREAFPPQDPDEQIREAIETDEQETDVPPADSEPEPLAEEHHDDERE